MERYGLGELRHILTTVFLSGFAELLVKPVMIVVTVAAVCSGAGLNDSCSLAVYLTGEDQVTVGLGTMVMMPVMGNLADKYGIKALLILPMCLSILPPGCISGVKSFAGVVAPFLYSPLTALFLSENAPFYFPGFSLLCVALSLSLLIKDVPSASMNKAIITNSKEEARQEISHEANVF